MSDGIFMQHGSEGAWENHDCCGCLSLQQIKGGKGVGCKLVWQRRVLNVFETDHHREHGNTLEEEG